MRGLEEDVCRGIGTLGYVRGTHIDFVRIEHCRI